MVLVTMSSLLLSLAPDSTSAASIPHMLGCPGAHAPDDHPEPRWMELFLRMPDDSKKNEWESLSTDQQVELAALINLVTCHTTDNTAWPRRVVAAWERTLPVLRNAIATEESDSVVLELVRLLAAISYFEHDLRDDASLLRNAERRIGRISDPTAKWYATEFLDWIREHRFSFAPAAD